MICPDAIAKLMAKPVFAFAVPLALVFGLSQPTRSHEPPGNAKLERREVHIPVRDFLLSDQEGRPFQYHKIKGKVVLVGFAYTSCPDVCSLITAAMRRIQAALSRDEKTSVYILTITTDPEIDRPKVLSAYGKRYRVEPVNWAFLTGDTESLSQVWRNFGVKVVRKKRGLIDHTPLTAFIDRAGVARVIYIGTAPDPDLMLADLRLLLGHRN